MEILNMRINWMLGFANHPSIAILVDKIPDDLRYKKKQSGTYTMYFAEKEGYVSFYAHNPNDQSGFYGDRFKLAMEDGTIELVKGPWSSRSSVMNRLGFTHSREVAITDDPKDFEDYGTFYAGYLTIEKLQEGMSKFMPEVKLIIEDEDSEISYEPVPRSAVFEVWDKRKEIGEELYPYRPPVHISSPMKKVKDTFADMTYGLTISEAQKQSICVCCREDIGKMISEYDRDGLGFKEYRISGLCPKCFPD